MKTSKLISAFLAAAILSGMLTFGNIAASEEVTPFLQKDNVISVYDDDGGFYKGMPVGTTSAEFLDEFEGEYILKNAKGDAVSGETPIGTDFTIHSGDNSRKIVIYGDVNRDSKVNLGDVSAMLKHIARWNNDINLTASDVTLDSKVNLADVSTILKYLAKWDVECGFVSWKYDLSKVDAPAEDDSLILTFTHSAIKESETVAKPSNNFSYDMYMAKNEYEGCHVNLYSKTGHTGLSASVTRFENKSGDTLETELFFEDYFTADTGERYPDRLPPISVKNGFKITESTTQGLFLKVKTDFDTAPGMYRARVDVKNDADQVVKRAYVYTYVWDFEVPEESSVKTAFGMGAYGIYASHGVSDDEDKELYIKYYEYFLENRVTTWCLPFEPTDERADKYMSDPRVSTFLVYGGYGGDMYGNQMGIDETTPAYLTEAYNKISANEDWAKKAIFYMNDEPRFGDQLKSIADNYSYINTYYPDARIIVPVHVNYDETGDWSDADTGFDNENKYPQFDGMDTYEIVNKYTTVLCPNVRLFTTPNMEFDGQLWYREATTEKYGTLLERLAKSREEGKETWWYNAGDDHISFVRSGMVNRTVFWQQYDYDIEGMLCWATTEWETISNRLQTQREIFGAAGIYVYCGKMYGIDGPVACLRTEIMRDGLEDFEYLVLAEKLFGKEVADEYNHRIVTDIVTFEKDAYVLEDVRRELGAKIEAALAEK